MDKLMGKVHTTPLKQSTTLNYLMFMLEREKMLVEGAGAAALAAILYNKVPICQKNGGCIISGGNVDPVKIQIYKEISKTTIKQYSNNL
jgi:threonine dehydratase